MALDAHVDPAGADYPASAHYPAGARNDEHEPHPALPVAVDAHVDSARADHAARARDEHKPHASLPVAVDEDFDTPRAYLRDISGARDFAAGAEHSTAALIDLVAHALVDRRGDERHSSYPHPHVAGHAVLGATRAYLGRDYL